MNTEIFWRVIEEARRASGDCEQICDGINASLMEFSKDDILHWGRIFETYWQMAG